MPSMPPPQGNFAPVAPLHILQALYNEDPKYGFGDYHLLLAHHTVERASEFATLTHAYHRKFPYSYPIYVMDNSLVELGGAVDDKMIREAVGAVTIGNSQAYVVPVLQDAMGDGEETRRLSHDCYNRWASEAMPGHGMMLVAQGDNWEDFCRTINDFFLDKDEYPLIGWVGIPRVLVKTLGTRARAIKYVQMVAPHVKIHLLGFSEHITDDLFCARMPGVFGIDSAVPVRYDGMLTPLTTEVEIGPRGDWWENGQLGTVHIHNLLHVRSWIRARD